MHRSIHSKFEHSQKKQEDKEIFPALNSGQIISFPNGRFKKTC